MLRSTSLALGILLAIPTAPIAASDHLDGALTTLHRAGDLTDLFAFPSPGRPGFLTIILNAYPLVASDGRFQDRVSYTILLRRASIRTSDGRAFFETRDETAVHCAFEAPDMTCRSSSGADVRLDAGMRSDPFFLNTDFFSHANEGKLDPPVDDNVMRGGNILALALEIDLRKLFADPPSMIAVAAEATSNGARRDRVGRPEFTNVGLAPREEPDLRDAYNLEQTFQVPEAVQQVYRTKLENNIASYDALDGRQDWQDLDRQALARLMADDFLVVDLDKPCPANSFLEIEKSMLRRTVHETCGGRRPEDDIVDTLYTLYVAGINGEPVRDGVDRPAMPLSSSFPYLATPDLSLWSRFRVFVGRKFLGIPDFD